MRAGASKHITKELVKQQIYKEKQICFQEQGNVIETRKTKNPCQPKSESTICNLRSTSKCEAMITVDLTL